jgi:phage protein D
MTTPTARISLDGRDITTRLIDKDRRKPLVSITITDEAGIKSDRCDLEIDLRESFAPPTPGSEFTVYMGYEPEPVLMGKYRVDSWSKKGPPNTLTVSASSADLTTAIKETKHRAYHEKTVASIVQEVAGRHSLGTAIDQDIGSNYVEHIDQSAESDMGFLTRLAKRHGATFKVANGTVIFAKKGSTTLPSGVGKPAITVKPVDVASWTVNAGERGAHDAVICYYHNHDTGKRKGARAGKGGDGTTVHRDKRVYATEAEANAAAKAQLGELTRGQKTGSIECVGNPAFFAEGVVVLDGFDPDADGQYYAKTVTHTFNGSGYTTSVALETTKSDPDQGD